jgi:hypothetical protein
MKMRFTLRGDWVMVVAVASFNDIASMFIGKEI